MSLVPGVIIIYGYSVPGNKMPQCAEEKANGLRLATKDGEAVCRDQKCGALGNLEAGPIQMEKKAGGARCRMAEFGQIRKSRSGGGKVRVLRQFRVFWMSSRRLLSL